MSIKYKQCYDGEWYRIPKKYRFMCCDCGLTEDTEFRFVKHGRGFQLEWRAHRDIKATARQRRKIQKIGGVRLDGRG